MCKTAFPTGSSLRACSVERERIARDLHDGVIQSLIATEMRVDLLRRRSSSPGAAALDVTGTLADVQDLIRLEVRKLRLQIEQLRSSTPPYPILHCLTEMVEGFQQETGIVTTLSCDIQEDSIPLHLSNDLLHIVEEGLSNVRRHSGARKVEVRFSLVDKTLQVVIQDDGCGFDFAGRLFLTQLDAKGKGPQVIKERVHSINGELSLESIPNRGTRLEIGFTPQVSDGICHGGKESKAG